MTKQELRELNAELIDLLTSLRDEIDEKLDDLASVEEEEGADPDDGDEEEAED
jgi:hypothetical protein